MAQRSWSSIAFLLAFVSLVFTFIAFVIGLILAFVTSSSATLGFALENAVDFFSSILVCWRFYDGSRGTPSTRTVEEKLELREKRASIGIGVTFVLLAFVVGATASSHLAAHEPPANVHLLVALAAPSATIFVPLGLLKVWVGYKTNSASMKKDGVCSLFGATLSLGVIAGVAVYGADEKLWFVDAVVALVVALLLLLVGADTLVRNAYKGNKYWTRRFWTESGVVLAEVTLEQHPYLG